MKIMAVGEFKTNFSSVLAEVRQGRSVAVGYGKSKKQVAVLVPYRHHRKQADRQLGALATKASFQLRPDFSLTDEELIVS